MMKLVRSKSLKLRIFKLNNKNSQVHQIHTPVRVKTLHHLQVEKIATPLDREENVKTHTKRSEEDIIRQVKVILLRKMMRKRQKLKMPITKMSRERISTIRSQLMSL
jgi:hypothetical protein